MNSSLDHIEQILGPKQALSLPWLVPLTFVYVTIFILGVIGNLATILVIFKFRYMQTLTNLYLCNLAITDLLTVTAGIPLELYSLYHQYPWQLGVTACHLKSLIPDTTAYASVLTLVTFTLERYLAICGTASNPPTSVSLNSSECDRLKRLASRNIVVIWIFSLIGALPLAIFTRINYLYEADGRPIAESAWCGLPFNAPNRIWETIMLTSTIVFFIIPLTIISVLYYFIVRTLKLATKLDPFNNPDMQLTDLRSSRKIMQSRKIVIRLLGVFYYLNSTVNPILYSVMSTRFRTAFSLYVADCIGGNSSKHSQSSTASRHKPSNHSDPVRPKPNGQLAGGPVAREDSSASNVGNLVVAKVHWPARNNGDYFRDT
ncbi:Neuromedin-U receptor 2 [Halotydeus destructor]|nr:Neuromedin-U receptor 2 [Halotydeus destructor]